MECLKCNSREYVKAGYIGKNQRYKCKACGCKFTRSTPRGKPESMKKFALKLYLEGVGFRGIGRLLNISNVSVLRWIKKFGDQAEQLHKEEISKLRKISTMEIDEMYHYIGKKTVQSGCGWLLIEIPKQYLGRSSVIVAEKHFES